MLCSVIFCINYSSCHLWVDFFWRMAQMFEQAKEQGSKALQDIFIFRLLVVKQDILSASNTAREADFFYVSFQMQRKICSQATHLNKKLLVALQEKTPKALYLHLPSRAPEVQPCLGHSVNVAGQELLFKYPGTGVSARVAAAFGTVVNLCWGWAPDVTGQAQSCVGAHRAPARLSLAAAQVVVSAELTARHFRLSGNYNWSLLFKCSWQCLAVAGKLWGRFATESRMESQFLTICHLPKEDFAEEICPTLAIYHHSHDSSPSMIRKKLKQSSWVFSSVSKSQVVEN